MKVQNILIMTAILFSWPKENNWSGKQLQYISDIFVSSSNN